MFGKITLISLFICVVLFGGINIFAQQTGNFPDASTANGRPQREDEKPKGFKENLIKRQIEQEKKEFEEMIKRSEEVAQLSEELTASVEKTQTLSLEDQKKLGRLEKLVKKIRDELGGEDDNETETVIAKEKTSTLVNTLKSVQENAANLLTALKKTTRLTISAVAIESSNTVLKLLKFIRVKGN